MQENKEKNCRTSHINTHISPGDNCFLISMLSSILCADKCKQNGRYNTYCGQCGRNRHITNDNTAHHSRNNRLACYLLCNFIRSAGGNVALQRTIIFQYFQHVFQLKFLLPCRSTCKVFRFIKFWNTNTGSDKANGRYRNSYPADSSQKFQIESSVFRHQCHIIDHV